MSVYIPRKGNRGIFVGIYAITSPSGSVYIGQSWDILARWSAYGAYRCKDQPALYNSLKKYGADKHRFEIIIWFSASCDQETLDSRERALIAENKARGVALLNIMEGGRGSRHTEETKAKIGAANRCNRRPDLAEYNRTVKPGLMRGRKLPETTIQKMRLSSTGKATCKGRVQSPEERAKRSAITKAWWAKRRETL